ncbi:rhodanese-like domain-containing protein [Luteolibacter algae]|uniref:Rhodanese-like domain-containing protein n=1 Tax=Luteolibacter algae TaxID=454151 RepID=A0ABW5DAC7_9BACT
MKALARKTPSTSGTILLLCTLPISIWMCSCSEPPEKPVPALDLSKAVKKEPAETADKPSTPANPAAQGRLTRMPLGDLYQLVQNNAALIYDVRPKFFYQMGHVPGATSWPKADFDRDLAKYEPQIASANKRNSPVVIYCTDMACPDALTVATALAKRGHDVSILQGGYEAWKMAN